MNTSTLTATRLIVALMLAGLSFSHAARAESGLEDIRFVTGASLGYTNFSFKEKLDQTLTFPSATVTLAATLNRWQVSLNGAYTLKDADVSEEEDVGDASREDIDLTIGYQINRNWAVFGGYKTGETSIDFRPREVADGEIAFSQNESYEQKGPYIGISYTLALERAGSLNFSAAYADLDADNKFTANTDEPEGPEELEFDDLTGSVSGDTKGISYALTWTMPLAGNWLFQTRFKYNDYQQDVTFAGRTFSNVDETLHSLHVGLACVF